MTHEVTDLAPRIQHTLIEAGVCAEDIVRHCVECMEHGFGAAMVPAMWVGLARESLAGTDVAVATAVDFPYGAMTTAGKVAEVRAVVAAGAQQIDTGAKVGMVRSGRYEEFRDDLKAVITAAGVPVKVMLELPLLDPAQRDTAVDLAVEAGVSYVKNASSGRVGAATEDDIRYLKGRVPPHVMVKASGGISTRARALALVRAGADLIGTSNGVNLVAKESEAGAADRTSAVETGRAAHPY
jgi:deoxyribose-phosphate aldolase